MASKQQQPPPARYTFTKSLREQQERDVHELLKSAGEATPVAISEHERHQGVYNIAMPIGDPDHKVYVSVPVKPEDPRLWSRAAESCIEVKLEASRSAAERAQAQDPVAGFFSDLFTDYHYRSVSRNSAQENDPEARKMFRLQKLGSFAPAKQVEEACWMFPSVPIAALGIDYVPFDDNRERPLYVSAPKGTLYRNDFGRGVAQYWCPSPSGNHNKNVYVVTKTEIGGLVTERPMYYGMLWQVPEWMVGRFGPMGVKSMEIDKDTVEFYRYGLPPLAERISEVRKRRGTSSLDADVAHKQMQLAFRDLMQDYPVALAKLLEDDDIVATKAYLAAIEKEDEQRRAAESASSAADRAAAEAPKASEMLPSRSEWSERDRRLRNRPADPRDYPVSYKK